ncbi:hypothetical protein AXG93_2651s1220 [Marchantia polymorpha subsp. ruderalis]|uniref:Uncharacterized protein n=1 Tax=Marchantia polymorpha subsp. ruderalis TaxID=1480154 RepID=A0A176WKY5_MARPO|nr:hypothetical protein AXG93_2651s1220 [Marchantia polymorpha subsp. ruderalis]
MIQDSFVRTSIAKSPTLPSQLVGMKLLAQLRTELASSTLRGQAPKRNEGLADTSQSSPVQAVDSEVSMASLVTSLQSITTKLKLDCYNVAAHTELPVCQLPFVLDAAVEDVSEVTQTPEEHAREEQYREKANEPLQIGEENSLPGGPAGGRQYDERDPETQLLEEEKGVSEKDRAVIVKEAYLSPSPGNGAGNFERNQKRGWSESACDEGATFGNEISASASIGSLSTMGNSEALIDRLLESLPIYDQGTSTEHYRIRAVVYGKIGEYFSKGQVRDNNTLETKQNAMDSVKMLTAMQQLADLILAEEGRSAADYNCRAQFFQNSAEIFCSSGDESRAPSATQSSESGGQKVERILQQLEDGMLSSSGRSIADYNRRANVFGKTADAVSARRSEAAAATE